METFGGKKGKANASLHPNRSGTSLKMMQGKHYLPFFLQYMD